MRTLKEIFKISFVFVTLHMTIAYAMEDVCFSPSPCCEKNIIYLVGNAQSSIKLAVQHISSIDIFEALLSARTRGVEILIVTDRKSYKLKTSVIYALQRYGADVKMPSMHFETNKFAVFDDSVVFTGSYNWTEEAPFHHSDNCIVLLDSLTVNKYVARFDTLWSQYLQ